MSSQGRELDPWGSFPGFSEPREAPSRASMEKHSPKCWNGWGWKMRDHGSQPNAAGSQPCPRLPRRWEQLHAGMCWIKPGPSTRSAPTETGMRETGRALRDTSRASLGSNIGIAANPGLGSLPESTWNPGFSGQLLPLFTALVYPWNCTDPAPKESREPPRSAINPTLHIPLSPELREYSRPIH